MSYLLSNSSVFHATSQDRSLELIEKSIIDSLTVDLASSMIVRVAANTELEIPLGGMVSLVAIAINSVKPVDLALTTDEAVEPVFTGVASNYHYRLFVNGVLYDKLVVKAVGYDTLVRVAVAGNLSAPTVI